MALADVTCATILLTNATEGAYIVRRQLNITRPITILGNPLVLPEIDAAKGGAARIFYVGEGGSLDLRNVRLHSGRGTLRPRYEGSTSKVKKEEEKEEGWL